MIGSLYGVCRGVWFAVCYRMCIVGEVHDRVCMTCTVCMA